MYRRRMGRRDPCVRIYYKSRWPSKGWVGIYWQDPANNWGDVPGKAGYDLHGAQKLSFWARGENGGERVHEFRIGGIFGQYPDSDVATLDNVRLTREWKKYSIDLRKKDLRHIIGGFGFIVLKAENSGGMTVYLDDILYEGPVGAVLAGAAVAVVYRVLGGTVTAPVAPVCCVGSPPRPRARWLKRPAAAERSGGQANGSGPARQLQLAHYVHVWEVGAGRRQPSGARSVDRPSKCLSDQSRAD